MRKDIEKDIEPSIGYIRDSVKNSDSGVCLAAMKELSNLAVRGRYLRHFPVGVLKRTCS